MPSTTGADVKSSLKAHQHQDDLLVLPQEDSPIHDRKTHKQHRAEQVQERYYQPSTARHDQQAPKVKLEHQARQSRRTMQIPDLRYADASEDDLDDQRHHSRANISQGCKVGQAPMVDTRQRAAKNARAPVFPPRAQHHHSSDSVVAHHDFDGYSDDEYENVQQSSPVFEKASTRRVKTPTSRVNEDNGSKRAARVSFAHDESSLAGNSRETIHDLKAEMLAKFGPLPKQAATGRKRLPEHDPENHEIKRLRCEERLPWNEIAERLNRERVLNGKSRLSEAAIYSRFVRNSPLIAQVKGDAEFDPREYMYMKQSRKGGGSKKPVLPPSFTEHHDLLLMESYAEARAKFWVYVAEQLSTASGKEYSPEHCAERFNQL